MVLSILKKRDERIIELLKTTDYPYREIARIVEIEFEACSVQHVIDVARANGLERKK